MRLSTTLCEYLFLCMSEFIRLSSPLAMQVITLDYENILFDYCHIIFIQRTAIKPSTVLRNLIFVIQNKIKFLISFFLC